MTRWTILADQLFPPEASKGDAVDVIVPDSYLRRGFGAVKVAFTLAAVRAYERELRRDGFRVRVVIGGKKKSKSCPSYEHPDFPRSAGAAASPAFLLSAREAREVFAATRRRAGWQTAFYREMRRRTGILGGADTPEGGRLTFDTENRRPWDGSVAATRYRAGNHANAEAWDWAWAEVRRRDPDRTRWVWPPDAPPGAEPRPFPATRAGWHERLRRFCRERLESYGPFQDAVVVDDPETIHSVLSPGLNAGLLTPREVLDAVLAAPPRVSVASREGFVRQVLGWREFVRAASVSVPARTWRAFNALGATARLPRRTWWPVMRSPATHAKTGIPPVDDAIRDAWTTAYLSHPRRLMVVANAMQLDGIRPRDVYDWFLSTCADAYPWVMYFNVFAMATWASAGEGHTSKPYVTSSAYLCNMIRTRDGRRAYRRSEPWAVAWDARYREYLARHAAIIRRHAPRMIANLPRT